MTPKADDNIIIKPAVSDDMHSLSEIAALSFTDPWSERLFKEAFESVYTKIFTANDNSGEIIGYVVLSETGDDISVDDIAVLPDFRRMGIGRSLLKYSFNEYSKRNFILEVRESNLSAIDLYKSMGFEQVGFRKRYYRNPDEGAVLMTRLKYMK